MAELRRVARSLVATVFAPAWDHPAKEAVEGVVLSHGFEPPTWYVDFKFSGAFELGPTEMQAFARAAGFGSAHAEVVEVDTGLGTPADLVDWRLGMAHTAPYVAGLTPDERARVRRDAEAGGRRDAAAGRVDGGAQGDPVVARHRTRWRSASTRSPSACGPAARARSSASRSARSSQRG